MTSCVKMISISELEALYINPVTRASLENLLSLDTCLLVATGSAADTDT